MQGTVYESTESTVSYTESQNSMSQDSLAQATVAVDVVARTEAQDTVSDAALQDTLSFFTVSDNEDSVPEDSTLASAVAQASASDIESQDSVSQDSQGTVSVTGTVSCACSNQLTPVGDIEVILSLLATGQSTSTFTNAAGYFSFPNVTSYTAVAISLGPNGAFMPTSPVSVNLKDQDAEVHLILEPRIAWTEQPVDLSFSCEQPWWADVQPPTYKCFCDNVQVFADSEVLPPIEYGACLTHNVTWSATINNTTITTFQFVTIYNTDWSIVPPPTISDWDECFGYPDSNRTGTPEISGGCMPVHFNYTDSYYGMCPNETRVERTWTATSCGVTRYATQYIYVQIAPVIVETPMQPYIGYCGEYSREWVANGGGAVLTKCGRPLVASIEPPTDCDSFMVATASDSCGVQTRTAAEFVIVARNSTDSSSVLQGEVGSEATLVLGFGDTVDVEVPDYNFYFRTAPIIKNDVKEFAIGLDLEDTYDICMFVRYDQLPTSFKYDAMACTDYWGNIPSIALTWIDEEVRSGVYYSLLTTEHAEARATIGLAGSNSTLPLPWPMPERVCQNKCIGY